MNSKLMTICAGFVALAVTAAAAAAQETVEFPAMPTPTKEHALLEQFAGEWTCESEITMPGETEPMTCKGTESTRMIGGFWLLAEGKADMLGMQNESMITLGYDPAKKKYVGTFICSAQDYLWEYEGAFDESGKKLVLTTVGPSLTDPTQQQTYQETIETIDADHKVFTSYFQDAEGKWQEIVSVKYVRVK